MAAETGFGSRVQADRNLAVFSIDRVDDSRIGEVLVIDVRTGAVTRI